jgi:hypothetical protein
MNKKSAPFATVHKGKTNGSTPVTIKAIKRYKV